MNHKVPSPNKKTTAEFQYAGEIRFGPGYFHLWINGLDFEDRVFGHPSAWSPDDRFIAVQEWHTTKESEGPLTSLVIFDLQEKKEWTSPIFAGFCAPISWEGHRLRHNDEALYSNGKNLTEKETDADLIEDWRPISQPNDPPNHRAPSAPVVGGR